MWGRAPREMLRIGFDVDGVFANMESELMRQARLLFGEDVPRRSADRGPDSFDPKDSPEPSSESPPALNKLQLTPRRQSRLWRHVQSIDNFWESLDEVEPGAVRRVAHAVAERRWEVIFLTKRPGSAGASSQVQTQRWFQAKGFALPSVFVVQGSRGRIASALGLDIVVDDRPENCLDVLADSSARAVLVWRDDEKLLPASVRPLGIAIVFSVAECLDLLMKIDAASRQPPGLVDRVRKLLGLKSLNQPV